ncbi:MAG: type II secretion system protein [Gammaproteobacteria bacterium]|nr:type II secretion system protein [Gammaproteobacteria bacterium]
MCGYDAKSCSPRRSAGFTYAGILFAIVVLGLLLGLAGTLWSTSERREREARLLWTGDQYRRAIASYYLKGPPGIRQYPQSLDDLITDQRGSLLQRHLRRLYPDPMTGEADWQLERQADGAIIGVRSASQRRPIKQAGFRPQDAAFEAAACYCDWSFTYLPQLANQTGGDPSASREL